MPATAPPAFPDYPADLSSGGAPPVEGGRSGETGSSAVPPADRVEMPGTPPGSPAGSVPAGLPSEATYTVQLQVASTAERAQEWRERAATIFRVPVRVDVEGGLHKLRVGIYSAPESAEEMRRDAVAAGYVDALVVSITGTAGGGGVR